MNKHVCLTKINGKEKESCCLCTRETLTCSMSTKCFSDCFHIDRDSLLASLLDGVRASGNRDVCVKVKPTNRGVFEILRCSEKQFLSVCFVSNKIYYLLCTVYNVVQPVYTL